MNSPKDTPRPSRVLVAVFSYRSPKHGRAARSSGGPVRNNPYQPSKATHGNGGVPLCPAERRKAKQDHARHSKGNAKLRRAGLGKGREASMGPPVISFEVPTADMAGRADSDHRRHGGTRGCRSACGQGRIRFARAGFWPLPVLLPVDLSRKRHRKPCQNVRAGRTARRRARARASRFAYARTGRGPSTSPAGEEGEEDELLPSRTRR